MILLISILMLSMIVSMQYTRGDAAIAPGTHLPTHAYLNVFPNPAGVGQQVTLGIFLASPFPTNEYATNFTVVEKTPSGNTITLGPYQSDLTGGTVAYFTPDTVGNYTLQFFYGGQVLTNSSGYNGLIADPSHSDIQTLVVQQEPVTQRTYPFTPLPNTWWQTPVSAENSQNWYTLTGAWYGFAANSFANTGSYNNSGYYNPYTESVYSGHVLWTKSWCGGGVAGGELGGDEVQSHYWSTFQYEPRYAPVIINGILYSTWYTSTTGTGGRQGIMAVDLYSGNTLWVINTTSILRCGMVTFQYTINEYGVLGPFIWTTGTLAASETGGITPANTGTQWNLFDGVTGKYVLSLVNGTDIRIRNDERGNLIGYFINTTAGTQLVHPVQGQNAIATNTGPHMTCVNLTLACGFTSSQFSPAVNTVRAFNTGYMWDKAVQTNISGVNIDPALALSSIVGNTLVLSSGSTNHGQHGYMILASMDQDTGAQLAAVNVTYSQTNSMLPYTRIGTVSGDGIYAFVNLVNYDVIAYNVKDCSKAWEYQMTGPNGAAPNIYDLYGVRTYYAKDAFLFAGLGGDMWSINALTGTLNWYTNTTTLQGPSGLETPYNVWPLWAFGSSCISNDVGYIAGGHEYNPPLFHGCQLYAVNLTDGSLVWSELDTSVTSTAIAYGKVVSLNAYDNQLYCFGKGPSAITVNAPSVGVSTATPITFTGSVIDVSPGTKQLLVYSNYPNGLPCVSDQSESRFMETVYQQQAMPSNVSGVPVTLSVIDSNNNFRQIGTTTSNALGTYSYTWTPDISGNFTVYAQFLGSNSYYPSSASIGFYASLSATNEPIVTALPQSTADMYFVPSVIAIIIVIIIVGAVLAMLMLRKRP